MIQRIRKPPLLSLNWLQPIPFISGASFILVAYLFVFWAWPYKLTVVSCTWLIDTLGWLAIPLLGEALLLVYLTVVKYRSGLTPGQEALLARIQYSAPYLGILGTLVGLSKAMEGLNLGLSLQDNLSILTLNVGKALGTTVWGIVISLAAYLQMSIREE